MRFCAAIVGMVVKSMVMPALRQVKQKQMQDAEKRSRWFSVEAWLPTAPALPAILWGQPRRCIVLLKGAMWPTHSQGWCVSPKGMLAVHKLSMP